MHNTKQQISKAPSIKKMIILILFCTANLYGASSSSHDSRLFDLTDKLHTAASHDYLEMAQEAIDAGADINRRYMDCASPLYYASAYGAVQVLDCLIRNKADINSTNHRGENALHVAFSLSMPTEKRIKIVDLLIAAGIDVNHVGGHLKDTALIALSMTRRISNIEIFPFMMRLIAAGADTSIKNSCGQVAADLASDPALARFLTIYPGRTAAETAIFDLAKGYFDPKSATVRGLVREHVEQVINTRKYSPDMINTLSLLVGFMKPSLTLTTIDLNAYFS